MSITSSIFVICVIINIIIYYTIMLFSLEFIKNKLFLNLFIYLLLFLLTWACKFAKMRFINKHFDEINHKSSNYQQKHIRQ